MRRSIDRLPHRAALLPSIKRHRNAFVAILMLSYFSAMVFPFQLGAHVNHALLTDNGAIFDQSGAIMVRGDHLFGQRTAPDRLRLELHAKSYRNDRSGTARIFSFSANTSARNLTIGQNGSDLVVRLRRRGSTGNGTPQYRVREILQEAGKTHEYVVDIDRTAFSVFVDGALVIQDDFADNPMLYWDNDFPILLGNERTLDRPWLGEISSASVQIDDDVFDLLATDQGLAHARPMFPPLDIKIVSTSASDLFVNFFGFVLLGFLTATGFESRKAWQIALLWAPVCLFAEGTQYLVATRSPTVSDLILNVAGAFGGATIYGHARWAVNRLRSNY